MSGPSLITSLWNSLPEWASFGGRSTRKNLGGQPIVNPDTDVDAQEYNSVALATAQMSQTSPFCVMQLTLGGGFNQVDWFKSQAGQGNNVRPIIEAGLGGQYFVSFPASITDQAGRVSNVNLGLAIANISYMIGGFKPIIYTNVIESNKIEINVYDTVDAAPETGVVNVSLCAWSYL